MNNQLRAFADFFADDPWLLPEFKAAVLSKEEELKEFCDEDKKAQFARLDQIAARGLVDDDE